MALTEQVVLDISRAQSQINELERKLTVLEQPINIPVNVTGEQAADSLRRELNQADNAVESLNTELRQTDDNLDRVGTSARRAGGQIDDAGRRGTTSFSRLTASAVGLVGALAAFQGFQALGRGLAGAISDASDLEESLSKATVVFGEFTESIETIASDAPRALGLSTGAALEATATFGNLFVALGLTQDAAADLAPDIVQLAADLASFNNISVDDAILSLRSGLVGEAEPLRRLGVSINAALVDAKALELGLVDSAGAVTEAGKVQARYALILEQTTTAQGDYARTSEGIANTQRTLKAEFENVSAAVGEALLPAYAALLELAPGVISAIEDLTPIIAAAAEGMASAVPSAQSFAEVLQVLSAVPTSIGILKELTDFPRDIAAGLGALLVADIPTGLNAIQEGLISIQNAADNFRLEGLRQGLVNALQAGIDPAIALGDALVALSDENLSSTELTEAASALTAIAGIDPTRAKDLATVIADQAEGLGIEKGRADAMILALRQLFEVETSGSLTRGASGRREAADAMDRQREAAERLAASAITEAEALDILEDFAGRTGQSLLTLLQNTDALPPSLQDVAAAVSETSVAFLDSVSRADEFAEAMREIPEAMADARAAFVDEAGEFEDDASEFVDRFIDNLANRAAFEANLQKLRDAGGDLLAAMLEAEGPEEAGDLLADFLANPDQIARGERAASDRAMSDAAAYLEDFLATIDAADFSVTPPNAEVVIPVVADLSAFLASIEGLPGVVDFSVPVPVRGGGSSGDGGQEGLGPQGSTVTVVQNFNTDNINSTQTERAAAEINSIVAFNPR